MLLDCPKQSKTIIFISLPSLSPSCPDNGLIRTVDEVDLFLTWHPSPPSPLPPFALVLSGWWGSEELYVNIAPLLSCEVTSPETETNHSSPPSLTESWEQSQQHDEHQWDPGRGDLAKHNVWQWYYSLKQLLRQPGLSRQLALLPGGLRVSLHLDSGGLRHLLLPPPQPRVLPRLQVTDERRHWPSSTVILVRINSRRPGKTGQSLRASVRSENWSGRFDRPQTQPARSQPEWQSWSVSSSSSSTIRRNPSFSTPYCLSSRSAPGQPAVYSVMSPVTSLATPASLASSYPVVTPSTTTFARPTPASSNYSSLFPAANHSNYCTAGNWEVRRPSCREIFLLSRPLPDQAEVSAPPPLLHSRPQSWQDDRNT